MPQESTSHRSFLRIGIFGAGRHAQHHARAIQRCRATQLVGVADPTPVARELMGKLAPDAVIFENPVDLLEQLRPDVVHICTPPSTHGLLAATALKSGCHIYVEKPFCESYSEARDVLALAKEVDRKVCAGHQLLFERPSQVLKEYQPALQGLVHIESYFSFRAVRRGSAGRLPLRADQQLLDILPHPVYLLLQFLETRETLQFPLETLSISISRGGTVHALLRKGEVTATLVVTLQGRPVESYLKLVGRNGSLVADYVRGTVQRHIGPGVSGIDKVLAPYSSAWQLTVGTTNSLARRVAARNSSYPGLIELFSEFYSSIREDSPSPISDSNILETTRLCVNVAQLIEHQERSQTLTQKPGTEITDGVLVTGGTGFLGRAVVEELLGRGYSVRVVSRRMPAPWDRDSRVEYAALDLAGGFDSSLLDGIGTIIHAAAETSGDWADHQRNSVDATVALIRRAHARGITRFIHVSSLAVVRQQGSSPVPDGAPLETNSRKLGPYVWGKLESERQSLELGSVLGVDVKIVRPGPIIDSQLTDAPGRLGKRIGGVFVAVGSGKEFLYTTTVNHAARVLASAVGNWRELPTHLNLLDSTPPTRAQLVEQMRRHNPDLRVIWVPRWILTPLAKLLYVVQLTLRPGKVAMDVSRPFAQVAYISKAVTEFVRRTEAHGTSTPSDPNKRG